MSRPASKQSGKRPPRRGPRKKSFKVVMLGEGRVGKTSILLRYCRNEFDGKQQSTLNASYMDRRLNVGNEPCQLSIWDTAGQERFHALGPIYYRDADAALLVYDITDAESFNKVKKWVRELRKIVGDDIAIAIAGNKIDLEKDRHVNDDDAKAYATSVGASHFHTSAKLNKGLEEAYLDLAKKILARKAASGGSDAALGASGSGVGRSGVGAQKRGVILTDDAPAPKSGGCC